MRNVQKVMQRIAVGFFFMLCIVLTSQAASGDKLFEELQSQAELARKTLDRPLLDSIGNELLQLAEETRDQDILHYANFVKADALIRKNPESAISFGVKAKAFYEATNNKLLWSRVTNVLASAYSNIGSIKRSLELYDSTLIVLDQVKDQESSNIQRYESIAAYNAGYTSIKLGDLERGLAYLSQSHEVAIAQKDTLLLFSILIQYGNANLIREDFVQALEYFKESYRLAEALNPNFTVYPMFGIGATYQESGQLDSALVYNLKVLERHRSTNNVTSVCLTLFNCAELFIDLGRVDDGIALANELMIQGKELGASQHILNAANALGRAYYLKGDILTASSYMSDYEKYIDDEVEYDLAKEYYNLAATIAEESGNYPLAYEYHKLYKAFSDSLLNQNSLEKLDELQLKLESEKKDQKIATLESANNISKVTSQRNAITIVSIAISALFFIIIAALYLNSRRLKAEHKRDQIEQKLLRSQMNPHFIFNAISSIQNYLYDKSDLKIALNYMSQLGELMRQILENSREEYVSLAEEIKTLKNYLELQQLRYSNSFGYEFVIDDDIDIYKLKVPPLIAQPFVENSIEHGMIYRIENGLVRIVFSNYDKKLEISIEDNGVGAQSLQVEAKNMEQRKKSLATIITKERLEHLSKINKESFNLVINRIQEGGTQITIQLPLIQMT